MAEFGRSCLLFVEGMLRHWYVLLPGVAGGGLDVYERLTEEQVDVPDWIGWAVLGLSVFVAAAWSFHDARGRANPTPQPFYLIDPPAGISLPHLAQVTDRAARGAAPVAETETDATRLELVLRDLLRQGRELDAVRKRGTKTHTSFEVDQLEDWTQRVADTLIDHGDADLAKRFLDADVDAAGALPWVAHRAWAGARLDALAEIVAEVEKGQP